MIGFALLFLITIAANDSKGTDSSADKSSVQQGAQSNEKPNPSNINTQAEAGKTIPTNDKVTVAAEDKARFAALICKSNWRKCNDNSDIANNYKGMLDARVSCRREAGAQAKYGTPEWPWVSFEAFMTGNDAPETGMIILIENKAKFQNAFGAMAHVLVKCLYSLSAKKVIEIEVPKNDGALGPSRKASNPPDQAPTLIANRLLAAFGLPYG
jgi:hypothetical protein